MLFLSNLFDSLQSLCIITRFSHQLLPRIRIVPTILKQGPVAVKGISFSKERVVGPLLPIVRVYQSRNVDELVILDVAKVSDNNLSRFQWLKSVASFSTMPLAVGGGIRNFYQASNLIEMGADIEIQNIVEKYNEKTCDIIVSYSNNLQGIIIDSHRVV